MLTTKPRAAAMAPSPPKTKRGPTLGSALAGLLLASTSIGAASGAEIDMRAAFLAPPSDAGAWKGMDFSGGDIGGDDPASRLKVMRDAGFSGVLSNFVAPSFGAQLPKDQWDRVNSFATPAYFANYARLLQSAKGLGMKVDSTFGSCWPNGGGFAITPELAAVELTFSRQTVAGGTVDPSLTIPEQPKRFGSFMKMFGPPPPGQALPTGWAERLAKRARIVAVLAVKGGEPDVLPMNRSILSFPDRWGTVMKPGVLDPATTLNLTDKMDGDGRLHWTAPDGAWQVLVFRQAASDMVISCGAGQGPQLVLNDFDRKAFDAHAARVFGAGMKDLKPFMGDTLHGYFIDSSEYASDIFWTDNFQAEFKRRRGYDLTPYLPFVFQPGWMLHPYQARFSAPMYDAPDVGPRVLSDYRLTVSELMTENFYQPFADLMHAHGLTAKIQAHGAPVDTLKVYGLSDIPETEDLHVGPDPYFLRMARAAGDLYGRHLITSETLFWDDGGPSISPQMLKHHIDQMLLAGVNQIRMDGLDPPPQKPGEPTSPVASLGAWIGPDQPTWGFVGSLNQYLQRAQAVLQRGVNVVPVAVYRADPTYMPGSATDEPKPEPEPDFIAALPRAGYDYDQISDDALGKARVVDHHLITPGGASFSALILPATPAVRVETADALKRFAAAGLPIVFVGLAPDRFAGLLDHERLDARVHDDIRSALASGAQVALETAVIETLKAAKVEGNLTFDYGAPVEFLEKADGDRRLILLRNPDALRRDVSFVTAAPGGAELWDPWSGQIRPQPVTKAGGRSRVQLAIEPYQTLVVSFSPRTPSTPAKATSPFLSGLAVRRSPIAEVSSWSLRAVGHGANGRPIDQTLSMPQLADWTTLDALRDFVGHGVYTATLKVDPSWLQPDRRLLIDFGRLSDGATLTVNGHAVSLPADGPYVADVASVLQPGANTIALDVFNTGNNAFAAHGPGPFGYRPAGLTGPVWLKTGPKD